MRSYRRSRVRSSRGHVRIEQGPPWINWLVKAGALVALGIVVVVVISQVILPRFKDEKQSYDNRTWLEYAWVSTPVNQDAVQRLGERLRTNQITAVYLEAAAWRTDGTLLDGEYITPFVAALREAFPEIRILLWLRMAGGEIAQPQYRTAAIDLAGRAVRSWGLDGVQLNGRALITDSEAYIQLVRDLRDAMGSQKTLSVTVPPDRIPTDPAIPIGPVVDPNLTWSVDYKQRVALVGVDEIVIMAHGSGLVDSGQYQVWVTYQVQSYIEVLAELDRPADIVVALPTYDAAPEHDPAVESISPAAQGVKRGIALSGKHGDLVRGVGLFEYKTTDSLEWALYAENWLGQKPD